MLYDLIDHLHIVEGIIIFHQPLPENKYVDRSVIPMGLYNSLFDLAHSGFGSEHRGIPETIRKVNKIYFMPGLNKFVISCVNNCVICLKKIGQVPKHRTPIHHTAYNTEVLGSISVDLIGPMRPCHYQGQSVKHILIMFCLFSRYVFTAAIKYFLLKVLYGLLWTCLYQNTDCLRILDATSA